MSKSSHNQPQKPSTDRILRILEVQKLVGLSRSQIYTLVARGEFPKQIKLGRGGARAAGWLTSEVQQWLNERVSERNQQEDCA